MKVDFTQVLCNFSGQPLKIEKDIITLKSAAVEALLRDHPGENLDGAQKFERYSLAKIINRQGKVHLAHSQVEMIRALIGKTFTPLLVGAAFEALSGRAAVLTGIDLDELNELPPEPLCGPGDHEPEYTPEPNQEGGDLG